MKISPNSPCPCASSAKFKRCCRPILRRGNAPTPEALMRSRFTAYCVGNGRYIIETTDPRGPAFEGETEKWLGEIDAFSRQTQFEGLRILDWGQQENDGFVHFRAQLSQGGQDTSFTEYSLFKRVDGRWLYHSARPQG